MRGCWLAPAIRANAAYLEEAFKDAEWTDSAIVKLDEVKKGATMPNDGAFPPWYVFKTNPFMHQMDALNKTYPLPTSALFMDMGTGKTKVEIDKASARAMENKIDAQVITCPFSIRRNWEKEIAIHCPLPTSTLTLDTSKKPEDAIKRLLDNDDFKWLFVGIESLAAGSAWKYVERFMLATRSGMAIDESSRIKNPKANRSERCCDLGKLAKYRDIMSGTPITQGMLDLYMQFEFLDDNIIGCGDFWSFRNRYAEMGGFEGRQVVGYKNSDELLALVSPYVFQVRKKEALPDLIPKSYTIREVKMSPKQKVYYDAVKRGKLEFEEGKEIQAQNVLEKMLRLHQVAGGIIAYPSVDKLSGKPIMVEEVIGGTNPKVEELIAITEEKAECSTIVWCKYQTEIATVAAALRDKYGDDQVVEFHGEVEDAKRWENVDAFEAGKVKYFVGNPQCGGIGINLIAASLVIYYSNSFSLEDRLQSEDRAHRSGQTKAVTYVDVVCVGTVDLIVLEALNNKNDLSEYVRGKIDEGIKESDLY